MSSLPNMQDAQQRYLEYFDSIKDRQSEITEALEFWKSEFDGAVANQGRVSLEPKELVESTFEFVERLIAAQKKLAFALVESAA
jgi:hypothetical protein